MGEAAETVARRHSQLVTLVSSVSWVENGEKGNAVVGAPLVWLAACEGGNKSALK